VRAWASGYRPPGPSNKRIAAVAVDIRLARSACGPFALQRGVGFGVGLTPVDPRLGGPRPVRVTGKHRGVTLSSRNTGGLRAGV